MRWDAGAASTVITKEPLNNQFQRCLPYRVYEGHENEDDTSSPNFDQR